MIIAVGWRAWRPGRTQVRELTNATITMLDIAKRTAEVEFVHPRTGHTMRLTGTVSPDCEIFVNDRPASLADLRVGDTVAVGGIIDQGCTEVTVQARWVRAARAAPGTQASSGRAAGAMKRP